MAGESNLGPVVQITMREQEARYLLGVVDYVKSLQDSGILELDDFIDHLADAGVQPEDEEKADLLAQAKVTLSNRHTPISSPPEELVRSISGAPKAWQLSYIESLKQAGPLEADRILQTYNQATGDSPSHLSKMADRSLEVQKDVEAKAYASLMTLTALGILDADRAGELMETYRPGKSNNP